MINKDNKYSGNKDNIHQGNRDEDKNDNEGIMEKLETILENTRNNENIDKRLKIRTSDNNINLHSSIRIWMWCDG